MSELHYIIPKQLKDEYRNDYAVNIILGYHNLLTHYNNKCYGCESVCGGCEVEKDISHIMDELTYWCEAAENQHPHLKGKLTKAGFGNVWGDENMAELIKQPRTRGRCTGIQDKNGTMLYEGDVITTKYGRKCEITFLSNDSHLCFDMKPLESEHPAPDEYDIWNPQNLELVTDED